MSKQYFKVIEVNLTEKTNGNYNVVEPKCLVTPKGVDFIYNLLKKNNYILSGTSDSYLELTQKSINNYNQQLLDDYNDDDIDIVVQTPKQQVTVHTKSDNSIFKQHSIPHMSKSMLNKLKESL